MPLDDEETTILQLYTIAERLTNVVQKHSAEAFRQINHGIEGFWLVTLSAEVSETKHWTASPTSHSIC